MKYELVLWVDNAASMYTEYHVVDTETKRVVAVFDESDAKSAYALVDDLNK